MILKLWREAVRQRRQAVEEIRAERTAWARLQSCKACGYCWAKRGGVGGYSPSIEYCGPRQRLGICLQDVAYAIDQGSGHLHRKCHRCGFDWIEPLTGGS